MAFNFGGYFDGGYKDVAPGYKNPLPEDTKPWTTPEIDWGKDWEGGSNIGDYKWGVGKNFLDSYISDKGEKYRRQAEKDDERSSGRGPSGGQMLPGTGGNLGNGLSYLMPQTFNPVVVPGTPGKPGFFGSGGGALIGGLLAPFTGGASAFIGQGLDIAGRVGNF